MHCTNDIVKALKETELIGFSQIQITSPTSLSLSASREDTAALFMPAVQCQCPNSTLQFTGIQRCSSLLIIKLKFWIIFSLYF